MSKNDTRTDEVAAARARLVEAQGNLVRVEAQAARGEVAGRDLTDARSEVEVASLAATGAATRAAEAAAEAERARMGRALSDAEAAVEAGHVRASAAVEAAGAAVVEAMRLVAELATALDTQSKVRGHLDIPRGNDGWTAPADALASIIWPALSAYDSKPMGGVFANQSKVRHSAERWVTTLANLSTDADGIDR